MCLCLRNRSENFNQTQKSRQIRSIINSVNCLKLGFGQTLCLSFDVLDRLSKLCSQLFGCFLFLLSFLLSLFGFCILLVIFVLVFVDLNYDLFDICRFVFRSFFFFCDCTSFISFRNIFGYFFIFF